MESEAVRRRVNIIAAHFAPADDISSTHLLPMNCSGSLNSVIPRCDNRVYFARQCSASQAFFMRQGSTEQPGGGFKCTASQAPLFSRPTKMDEHKPHQQIQSPPNDFKSALPAEPKTPPCFARPSSGISRKKQQSLSNKKIYSPQPNGIEWSPRMDVAESERSYVLTVELPGADVNDIRVEVNNHSLLVRGKRSIQKSEQSISAYHKREILLGRYQVVWPFPSNVNRDNVSAEFLKS
ncbi:uncharacterized protein LOC110620896 isoform X2 [Manihot esculenta]|uniref:uncharacterized protein LOC110620896 isoform X2 n=1 Tax=Manihot esculenta TaxID=3983 RepID=UPI001CC68FEA|nr:uncharacterized protein LOC110620896 isoform X2 [Manihot esculenta]